MHIVWHECKKAFKSPILIGLLLLFTAFNVFVIMDHSYFKEEFLDFQKAYDKQVKEADQYLQSRREFVEAGLDTYEKFKHFDRDYEELYSLHSKVMFEEKEVNTFWELQERERLIEFYDMKDELRGYDNAQQKQRMDELIAAKNYGVYPSVAIENFRQFIANVTSAILFSVALVISPMILKDRSRQMLALQYTSKKGRNLYKTKIIAGLISTFIVITALLIVYLSIYSLNKTSMFFEVPINTFIANEAWYDPTFFQYILLCVAAIYVLGFVFGLLAMSFSSIVPNTMALIGIQLPFIIGMIIFGMRPLMRYIISIWNPQWLAPTVYSGMVVVGMLFIILLWKREKDRDIVL